MPTAGVRSFDLLILDYAGVCTPAHAEFVEVAPGETVDPERPEAIELIGVAQKAGLEVAILSNELDPSWTETSVVLRLVDRLVSCTDNGILKPDRRAFQRCLLLAGASASRTIVVDDELDNVTVAASLGMRAIHLNPADHGQVWVDVRALIEGR